MSFYISVHCYHALNIYTHPLHIPWDVKVCKHLGVHKHYMSNGTCRESLDMAYQCIANEVYKTNNSLQTIYLNLHQMVKYSIWQFLSLEVIMDTFSTFASPNCRKFVWGSKHFIHNKMNMIDSIIYNTQRPFGLQIRLWQHILRAILLYYLVRVFQ
jgi:hypothetical protein